MDPTQSVRESTARVVATARHVHVDTKAIDALAHKMHALLAQRSEAIESVAWDSGDFHYYADVEGDGTRTCQYIFVLDALNFCFWPTQNMEYEHLARGLKRAMEKDPKALDADRLVHVSTETLVSWFHPFEPPQVEERKRRVQELGLVLLKYFDGLAVNVVKASDHSAVELVRLLLAYLPGFRDHAVYRGEQVHFYKRAQILVGDIWAAFGRRVDATGAAPVGAFHDIDQLTMFADYRVPQVLRPEGVMVYSEELAKAVDSKQEIPSASEMEIEIRAATIQAVEQLQRALCQLGHPLKVVELDWLLWQLGEEQKDQLKPHHRTWSIYY